MYARYAHRQPYASFRSTGPPVVLVTMRPDTDANNSGWTDQANGTTNLYLTVDETTPNDTDYVQSQNLGALWTPADIPSQLSLWLDASTGPLTFSGGNLTVWGDKSPLNNIVAPSLSSGPTLTTINGLNAIRFNYQPLNTAATFSFGDFSNFILFRSSPTSTCAANERLFDHDYQLGFHLARNGTSETFGGAARATGWAFFDQAVGAVGILTQIRLASATTLLMGHDGSASIDNNNICDGTATATQKLGICGLGANGNETNADTIVGEVLCWARALTTVERQKVEGYLAWKWGIQNQLPITHPCKFAPPDKTAANMIRLRMSDPSSGIVGPVNLKYRYGLVAGSGVGTLTARLKQGATVIRTWIHFDASSTFRTVAQTLTATELASITDFNNLFMEFSAGSLFEQPGLVLSYIPGPWRHDATGRVGFRFRPTNDVTYSQIGARCGGTFTGNHTVYLFDHAAPATLLRSAVIDFTGKPGNVFQYANITPITLTGGTDYCVMTDITSSDGQDWADAGATTLMNASNIYAVYSVTAPYTTFIDFGADYQYFGVDLR